ncbi:hypothetical protein [Sporosarcina jiandibaonis]|uniref:hypothetical protein n=1 Tax=Sporosarcina jiandibaonis TaxID=2715535 RepID=UPI001557E3E2|nr:hypothetical protein [Sporosarcina jiandibaonis]
MRRVFALIIIGIILVTIISIKEFYFSPGKVKVIVQNDTLSAQTIWLPPKEDFIFDIPKRQKKTIKYSLENDPISLVLHYVNPEGKEKTVMLSEYVEKSYQGKVTVTMTQKESNGELAFDVKDKIR